MLGVGCLAVAGTLGFFLATRSPTPGYAGRSAESWLCETIGPQFVGPDPAVVTAFREMGTNGVAFLVGCARRRDGAFGRFYRYRVLAHLSRAVRERLPKPVYGDAAASYACTVLSQLVLERRDRSPEQTLPCLVDLLEDGDALHRQHAALLLSRYAEFYPEIDFTVFRARLTRALNDTDEKDSATRYLIARTLNHVMIHVPVAGRNVTTSSRDNSQSDVP